MGVGSKTEAEDGPGAKTGTEPWAEYGSEAKTGAD